MTVCYCFALDRVIQLSLECIVTDVVFVEDSHGGSNRANQTIIRKIMITKNEKTIEPNKTIRIMEVTTIDTMKPITTNK